MKFAILCLVIFGYCNSATVPATSSDGSGEPQLCPAIIRYNLTFWIDHFNMKLDKASGGYWAMEYMSGEMTTDLPPMFPEGESRAIAMHLYMLLGPMDKMWLVQYPSDMIMHWYQGATARVYVFDPKTGMMEKRILNARNVVTVVEAGYWSAADLRADGTDNYVLLGCTMVPGVIDAVDMKVAKPGQIATMDKRSQRMMRYFTRPPMMVEPSPEPTPGMMMPDPMMP